MPTVTLLTKIYQSHQVKIVEGHIKALFKGLKVNLEGVNITAQNRIQITFSGEDEEAALSYLEKEIGLCPTSIENVRKFSTVKGHITWLGKSKEEICVDVGLTSPKTIYAIIPLLRLQAQLADGRKIALKKLSELFGLCENLPVNIKVTGVKEDCVEAEMAEEQLRLYRKWAKTLLDRLIVIGASKEEVKNALKDSRSQGDIVEVESLGLFEHAIVCKLGTDSVGLIPKVGKKLPSAALTPFIPKKLLDFFGAPYFTWAPPKGL
ncbi:MAG: DUF2110 family protein [Candidatus Bathyarchaeia archaeon]